MGGEEGNAPELRNHQHSRKLLSKKEGDPKQVPSNSTGWSMDQGVQNRSQLPILAPYIQKEARGQGVSSEFPVLM